MANTTLFNTRTAALPAADSRNEAGGKAYAFSAKHALAQYAVTGCLNGTYYAAAGDQLDTALRLCGQVPVEFIAVKKARHQLTGHHPMLLANALAQAQALMLGQADPDTGGEGHRRFVGNRPSTFTPDCS